MSLTHSEALQNFIDHLKDKRRSPSTIVAYRKDIEQLFSHYGTRTDNVSDYTTSDIQNYIDILIKDQQFTLKTISRKINSYKTLFKYLYKEEYIKVDIASPISHPKFKPKEPRILSSLEYKALRDTARNNARLYAMIELLLQTGMRIGELSRLKVDDIHADSNPSDVRIEAFASNPERRVPLTKDAIDAIKVYMNTRPKPKNDDGYLFTTKSGKQVLVRNIRTMINNAFKKSGINDVTVNDIRNTFIVYQLEHGMPLERVADIVGHQRLTSTEKYLNLIEDKKKTSTGKITPL